MEKPEKEHRSLQKYHLQRQPADDFVSLFLCIYISSPHETKNVPYDEFCILRLKINAMFWNFSRIISLRTSPLTDVGHYGVRADHDLFNHASRGTQDAFRFPTGAQEMLMALVVVAF